MSRYLTSVGMEVHAELATRSKMFCRCPVAFGGEPNTRVCPVCLGLPGALPSPNYAAIEAVIRTALALNCTIARSSIFHRKNYFYPDLPKGYQVSQYGETNPIGYDGHLDVAASDGALKRIRIRRVHLEEDTGKLMHLPSGSSGVDYNRSGVPLMEVVTEFPPDIASGEEARDYLQGLRLVLLTLGVCDGKLEEGSLRCEPNVSVRLEGAEAFGTKTELKNLNSFRSVGLGVAFEAKRQIDVLESGGVVAQETRGWNETKEVSFPMRVKEAENDYRYFPDPDLAPMEFDDALLDRLRAGLPELPLSTSLRFRRELGLSAYDAGVLTAEPARSRFFEAAVALGAEPKLACNWIVGELGKLLNESAKKIEETVVTPAFIVDIINLVMTGAINGKTAKAVFAEAFESGRSPSAILAESGASQISDAATIEAAVRETIAAHPDAVEKFKAGQTNVAGFFVGQVMRTTGGRANPGLVQDAVRRALEQA